MNIAKTLLFMFLIPGTLLIWVPYKIALSEPVLQAMPAWLGYAAFPFWTAGAAMLLWSGLDFALKGKGTPAPIDPPKVLVGQGLYQFVRNPMYLGGLLILLGDVLWFRSVRVLIYAAAVTSAFHLFVVFYEERVLRAAYGDAYIAYCRNVPRWIPRVRKAKRKVR